MSLRPVQISYGLGCIGAPGSAVSMSRRTPVCIGQSGRTVPAAAAVRVGVMFVQLARRTGSAELIADNRTFW